MLRHPENRKGAISEAVACLECGKGNPDTVRRQIEAYRAKQTPNDTPVPLSGLIAREHNRPDIVMLMNDWWKEITQYSYRDQISFPFVAAERQSTFEAININPNNNKYISFLEHAKPEKNTKKEKKSNERINKKPNKTRGVLAENKKNSSSTQP